MEPIRILQVVGKMHYGGMETLIMNIYRHIDRSKVQFDFLVHYEEPGEYDDEIRAMGGKIYVMPRTIPQNYFKYKKALISFFSQHKEYRIIHGHLQSTAFLYHNIAKKYGGAVCCITHAHANGRDHGLRGWITWKTSLWAQKYTDVFFGCSQSACQYFFPKAIAAGAETTVITNGIALEDYQYNSLTRDIIRSELSLKDQFVVGHVGRFTPAKNHGFLLQIFSEIRKINSNAVLLLVGKGPMEEEIHSQIHKMHLENSVIFLGVRSDVNIVMQAMDALVLPSLYEGLGITLIEGQASGLPCYTSADVVPQEAHVSSLLKYISLNQSPDQWARRILEPQSEERRSPIEEVRSHGYDICKTASFLQSFYLIH